MKVLATDADDKKTLSALRYLGREDVEVWAGGTKRSEQFCFLRCVC